MFWASLNKRKNTRPRRGFILVSVLLLGVVFISCATAFAWFARLQVKGALREKKALESRSMAQVLTAAVASGLKSNTSVKYDTPLQRWFAPFFFPADTLGVWRVEVTPLDDKIPLRHIFLPDETTLRNEMRHSWEAMWDELQNPGLGYAVLDFLDKDSRPRMGGVERENFINRPLLDISELLILEEMTPAILYGGPGKPGVADYCTLWSGGRINLNVAPARVLAVLPGLDEFLAEKIVEYRKKTALTSISDLRGISGFPAKAMTSTLNLASVDSRYFMIRMDLVEETGGGVKVSAVIDKTSGKIVRWEEI